MENRRLLFVQIQPKNSKEINRNKLEGPRQYEEAVPDRVRTTLAECENGEFMSVDIENWNVE